jgi:hypothetical protein
MRYSGATDLLMTHEQMVTWANSLQKPRLPSPYHFSDFESLSPLQFGGLSHLQVVLTSYQQRYKKGRTKSADHSPANRDFSTPGNDSGLARAQFEHGRCGLCFPSQICGLIKLTQKLLPNAKR